jgi:hypothetical protein
MFNSTESILDQSLNGFPGVRNNDLFNVGAQQFRRVVPQHLFYLGATESYFSRDTNRNDLELIAMEGIRKKTKK